ncbi:hypothetical protein JOB18_037425 [Solea senegalensis]|uniref:Uncharacterized protein n=1 Tax=Solea senegalensis TaxID=28829 RepID=A0AAV6RMX3_SOLSE|nr:hypothetical protein JOB18_037425 [Solea senegalensis]
MSNPSVPSCCLFNPIILIGASLLLRLSCQSNKSANDAVNMTLHFILHHLNQGLQLGLQHHHPRHPPPEAHPARCSSDRSSVPAQRITSFLTAVKEESGAFSDRGVCAFSERESGVFSDRDGQKSLQPVNISPVFSERVILIHGSTVKSAVLMQRSEVNGQTCTTTDVSIKRLNRWMMELKRLFTHAVSEEENRLKIMNQFRMRVWRSTGSASFPPSAAEHEHMNTRGHGSIHIRVRVDERVLRSTSCIHSCVIRGEQA